MTEKVIIIDDVELSKQDLSYEQLQEKEKELTEKLECVGIDCAWCTDPNCPRENIKNNKKEYLKNKSDEEIANEIVEVMEELAAEDDQ